MDVSSVRPNACVTLCALGSCLNLVWCTLMGHTLGFMPASDGMQGWTNPRTFFLVGILILSLLFAVFPHGMRKGNKLFVTALPLLASMLMYGKEASNRKQEIDRQHYTIPNQRPKDKHCGKI